MPFLDAQPGRTGRKWDKHSPLMELSPTLGQHRNEDEFIGIDKHRDDGRVRRMFQTAAEMV